MSCNLIKITSDFSIFRYHSFQLVNGTFGTDGQIDFESCSTLYSHLIRGGVDGILILGSIGEFIMCVQLANVYDILVTELGNDIE